MVIRSMTATFGCLENATLELKEGLNLLEMPNESGKSTWCAFLRAMFYGLESRKGGAFSERSRALPWSGAAMAGTVDLIWQGRAVTLRRFPKGSDPFGGFQAVYTGTEEPVPGLTAANVGERVLGATKEVFQRTCFIPQGAAGVDASGDLERRVAALAASGEEDVSFSEAEKRLRDWRNARQSNRATGTLPKLRARLSDVQARRQQLLDARRRGQEAQAALEPTGQELAAVRADLERHSALEEAGKLADARARYEAAADRLFSATEALAPCKTAEAEARAAIPAQPGPAWLWAVPLLAGVLLALLLALLALFLRRWPFAALGCLLAGAGLGAALFLRRRHDTAQTAHIAAQSQWQAARTALDEAQAAHIAAQAAWDAIAAQGEPPRPPEPGDLPQNDLAWDRQRLDALERQLLRCREQIAQAQGEEAALGGLEPLEEAIAQLEEAIAREEGELAALNLALDALAAANAQLQARFSPALNAEAGAILAQLTGGRYDKLTFTREFEALAHTGAGAKSARLLSQGTADQVYLALRLALCRLTFPAGDRPPMILDDALVSFDDRRLSLALAVLSDLADQGQILLFTCQSREGSILG